MPSNFTSDDNTRISTIENKVSNLQQAFATIDSGEQSELQSFLNETSQKFVYSGFVIEKISGTMRLGVTKDSDSDSIAYVNGNRVRSDDKTSANNFAVQIPSTDSSGYQRHLIVVNTAGLIVALSSAVNADYDYATAEADGMLVLAELHVPASTLLNLNSVSVTLTDKRRFYAMAERLPSYYVPGRLFMLTAAHGSYSAGLYAYNGSTWNYVAPPTGGVIPVFQGGTGVSSFASGNVLIGNGTSPIVSSNLRVVGQVLSHTDGTSFIMSGTATDYTFYTPNVTNMRFQVGANPQVTITNDGKLGVGSNLTPVRPLHVYLGTNQNFWVENPSGRVRLSAANNAGSAYVPIELVGEDIRFLGSGEVERGRFNSSGNFIVDTDTLVVDAVNNRVGIGTQSPLGKFDSRATFGPQLVASYNDSVYTGITTDSFGKCTISPTGNAVFAAFFVSEAGVFYINNQASNNQGVATAYRTLSVNRGLVGATHHGSGSDGIFSGEAADFLGIRGENGIQIGVGSDKLLHLSKSGAIPRFGINQFNPQHYLDIAATLNGSGYAINIDSTTRLATDTIFNITGTAGTSIFNIQAGGSISASSLSVAGNLIADTNTLVVDAFNNRVGIGTSSPGTLLNIVASVDHTTAGSVLVRNTSTGTNGMSLYYTGDSADTYSAVFGSTGTGSTAYYGSQTAVVGSVKNIPISFLANNDAKAFLLTNGNFGLGTSSPLGKLDSRATSGAQIVASYDGSNYTTITTNSSGDCTIAPSGGDLAIIGNLAVDTSTFVVDAANNRVGIGTASPVLPLDMIVDGSSGTLGDTAGSAIGISHGAGASAGQYPLTFRATGTGAGTLTGGQYSVQIVSYSPNANALEMYTTGATPILLGTNSNAKMLISPSGAVGIGSNAGFSPLGRLDSRSTSGAQLVASYDGSNYTAITTNSSGDCAIAPSGGDLAITGNASVTGNLAVDTSTLVVDAANNRVGINTVPSYALHLSGSTFRHIGFQYDVLPGATANFEFVNRNGYGFDWYVNSASLKPMRLDLNGNLLLGTDDLSSLDGTSGMVIGGIHEALAFAPTGSKARIIYNSSDELRIYDSNANINCVVLMSNHRWKMNYGFETGLGAWNAISDRLTFVSSTGYSHHQMSIQNPGSGLTQLYFRVYTASGSDGFTGGEWLQFTHDSKILLGATGAVPTQAYKLPGGSFQFTGVITSGSFGRLWKPGQLFSSVPYAGQYGLSLTYNAYYDGGWKSVGGGTGGALSIDEGILAYHTSNSVGSADAALTWTPRLVVEPSFGAGIGIANPNAGWHVVVNDGSYSLAASGSSCALRVTHSSGTTSLDSVDPTLSASYQSLNLQGSNVFFSVSGSNVGRFDASGYLGVGITTSIAARIHSVSSIGEQLRLGYNGSLFWGFGVNNGGQLNLTPSQGSTLRLVNSSIYSDYGYYFVDDRDIKPNQIPVGTLSLYFHTQGGMTGTSNNEYLDAIFLNSWSDSSGGAVNAITFSKNVGKRVQLWQAVQSATSWGTPSTFAFLEHTQIFTAQQEIVFAGRQFSLSYSGTHSTDLYTDSLGIMNIAPSGSGLNVNFTNGTTFFRIRDKNLQLGTETASGWGSDFKTYSSGYSGFGSWFNTIAVLSANAYNNGTNWLKRNTSAFGSLFVMNNGGATYLAIAPTGSSYNFNNIKFYTNYSGGISFLKGSPTSYAIEVGNNTSNGNGAYLSLTGIWTTTSDRSKKYDIYDCSYGLNEVLAMNPRFFKYLGSTETQIGFIAQELKSVIPEAVDGEEPKLAIKYNHLIPVLVKAIGELKAEIEDLRSQITN